MTKLLKKTFSHGISICLILVFGIGCHVNNKTHITHYKVVDGTKDSLFIGYEKENETNRQLIQRNDSNEVDLAFFEEFNDTVVVYVDGQKILEQWIHENNNPAESSGYSGFTIGIKNTQKQNLIRVELLLRKRFIEFPLNKNYPLCTIQRYHNIWYVNYRKYVLVLK